jgi:predicted phage baseplate assembly protein
MTRLAPDLFDRRFDDLVENGRSRLPGLAPAWTDHNAHDPGITLMELLAWVTEAQLYALARMRRDERASYAAVLGLPPRGPRSASGLIWPDRNPRSPAVAAAESFVIEREAEVRIADTDRPLYFPAYRTLWIAGQIVSVQTQRADGSVIDHTTTNARGEVAFLPFGPSAGPGDVLRLAFHCTGHDGLFPTQPAGAEDPCLVLGVRVDTKLQHQVPLAAQSGMTRIPYSVTMIAEGRRTGLEIVADSTNGFLRTGVCVLRLSPVSACPPHFSLEFRAQAGFPRPPRVLRIEPNVLPIEQARRIDREVHPGTGLPDQRLTLDVPGLRFGDGADIEVEVAGASSFGRWEPCERLADAGPHDRVYEVDTARAAIAFGNGINGATPPAGALVYVSYGVSDGAAGNVAAGKSWVVRGVRGVFGVNRDPIVGGADAFGDADRRREARRRVQQDHPLVTPADIQAAALALADLEVARAFVVPPPGGGSRPDIVTLVAMRARTPDVDGSEPESGRWLAAVARRLSLRVMLGSRLVVRAPKYVDFTVRVRVEATATRDPDAISGDIRRTIEQQLVLADATGRLKVREFGVGVSRRDIAAWIRRVPGVRRVAEVALVDDQGRDVDRLEVPQRGLPRIDLVGSRIEAVRAVQGRST